MWYIIIDVLVLTVCCLCCCYVLAFAITADLCVLALISFYYG